MFRQFYYFAGGILPDGPRTGALALLEVEEGRALLRTRYLDQLRLEIEEMLDCDIAIHLQAAADADVLAQAALRAQLG